MPISASAVKHLRQSEARRRVNRIQKDFLKEKIKDVMKLAKEKKPDAFLKDLPRVHGLIDKAVKNNLLHKNNAARKKSQLARLAASLK